MTEEKKQARIVTEDEADIRLDRWFKRHYPGLSHGQLEKLLRTGQVRVDGKRAKSPLRLQPGQQIRVPPMLAAEQAEASAPRKNSSGNKKAVQSLILYEDDEVIALNKPAGLAAQGGTGISRHLDAMLASLPGKEGMMPKLVHRLDRDTSGVMLVAKSTFAAAKLSASFRARDTRKIYWALTIGVPPIHQGKIEAPLAKRGERMEVSDRDDAKAAATVYNVVDHAGKKAAFVALWPLTGRTHQLRVHMQEIGTPILGDRFYGGDMPESFPAEDLGCGLHLHARRLIIPHPRRGIIDVTAPLSPDMQKSWKYFEFAQPKDDPFADF